jgi:hypothetical protein
MEVVEKMMITSGLAFPGSDSSPGGLGGPPGALDPDQFAGPMGGGAVTVRRPGRGDGQSRPGMAAWRLVRLVRQGLTCEIYT